PANQLPPPCSTGARLLPGRLKAGASTEESGDLVAQRQDLDDLPRSLIERKRSIANAFVTPK
ncbi:hypothetical protein ACFCWG_48110, partial [Streptomyces sp. NPDC056390]|uniref:hypothetical protein n=1 Tax=Streptomyces sp. NPDC056390 TaxID=3345806 RepID=UPI0035D5ACBC